MSDEITTIDGLLRLPLENENKQKPRCVVRLTTSMWYDVNGVHIKKTLRYLRRKCVGEYNILDEDCSNAGADQVIPKIINLEDCKDGVYEVVTCNEWGAWETPHIIEDYDYKLLPYEQTSNQAS